MNKFRQLEMKEKTNSRKEEYKYFVGSGMRNLMKKILPKSHRNDGDIEGILNVFLEHYSAHYMDNTIAYDGIIPLLQIKSLSAKFSKSKI